MKKNVEKLLRCVLLVVFLVSTTLLVRQFLDDAGGSDAYGSALEIALEKGGSAEPAETIPETQETEPPPPEYILVPEPVTDDPHMEAMLEIDLEALQEVNEDVLGWIRIPDTKIDYPLLQGEDNDYYLKHTWEKRKNSVGSIFLEHRNSPDLTDYNTIVYGHNMNSGAMFAGLRKYISNKYWREHPYVYILTEAGVYRYEIFASYKAGIESPTYGLSFHQTATREKFLAHALEKTKIETEIIPGELDRILTLSTCSGDGYSNRWVVQARLKMMEVEK